MKTSSWLFLILSPLVACASAGREAAWEKAPPAPPAGTTTATVSSDFVAGEAAWALRDDKNKVLEAIAAWEKVAAAEPSNAQVMTKLSRAYYFLVDGHISVEPGDVTEQKLVNHQKGADWGEKALLIVDPKFGEKMRAGTEFEVAIGEIEKPAIEAAYWYCTNLSRFANAKGLSARLFYKDRVSAAMRRIGVLDAAYFHAASDRFFGAYYSALPSIAGRDLSKSGEHFDKAIAAAPAYLSNKVLKADFLAVNLDDRALYTKLLEEVLAAPDGEDPDFAPENRAAKRQAKKFLALAGDRF
jgi:hypothetical protein